MLQILDYIWNIVLITNRGLVLRPNYVPQTVSVYHKYFHKEETWIKEIKPAKER